MTEEDRQMLQDVWRAVGVTSRRLEHVEKAVGALGGKLENFCAQLTARIDRTDLVLDRFMQQTVANFERVHSRIDDVNRSNLRVIRVSSSSIDARLDAIDGRLVTLTATVALHDLELREAT